MLDLRFLVIGKCDEKFRQVVHRIREKSAKEAQASLPVTSQPPLPEPPRPRCEQCEEAGEYDDDEDEEWEPIDG